MEIVEKAKRRERNRSGNKTILYLYVIPPEKGAKHMVAIFGILTRCCVVGIVVEAYHSLPYTRFDCFFI